MDSFFKAAELILNPIGLQPLLETNRPSFLSKKFGTPLICRWSAGFSPLQCPDDFER
jgi:hypothetical protein